MHIPVLTKEVLQYLGVKPGENFVDGTVGQAGHALLILEKNQPDGRVLGIDLDAGQIQNAAAKTQHQKHRIILAHDSYANIQEIAAREDFKPICGILLDLGYSSWQLEKSMKGFSFQKDERLDMRYSLENTLTAQKIVNEYPEIDLRKIIEEYGEEKFAKQIAKKIVIERQKKDIQTTFQLKEIIETAVKTGFGHSRIHSATRTFQALRIAVNNELGNLETFLPKALALLPRGGRLVIISFHSLEDRIVKNFFKQKLQEKIISIITPKPILPTDQEILENPRSRSAKLRAIIKN
jgi:16S rRNA (cytosine1402-N4)-methyltransferase